MASVQVRCAVVWTGSDELWISGYAEPVLPKPSLDWMMARKRPNDVVLSAFYVKCDVIRRMINRCFWSIL